MTNIKSQITNKIKNPNHKTDVLNIWNLSFSDLFDIWILSSLD